MLRATVNSVRQRRASAANTSSSNWLRSWLIPNLQAISRRASTHPIHTISLIAILASTTYIALLESSLFEPPTRTDVSSGHFDLSGFLMGSKTLITSRDTDWKWQNGLENPGVTAKSVSTTVASTINGTDLSQASKHNAILTLVFPEHTQDDGIQLGIPKQSSIASLTNCSLELLPPSKNLLSPISSDTTLTFSLPHDSAGDFLKSVHELPSRQNFHSVADITQSAENGDPQWVMTAMRPSSTSAQRSFKRRVSDAWTAFTDLLKVCTHSSDSHAHDTNDLVKER